MLIRDIDYTARGLEERPLATTLNFKSEKRFIKAVHWDAECVDVTVRALDEDGMKAVDNRDEFQREHAQERKMERRVSRDQERFVRGNDRSGRRFEPYRGTRRDSQRESERKREWDRYEPSRR